MTELSFRFQYAGKRKLTPSEQWFAELDLVVACWGIDSAL